MHDLQIWLDTCVECGVASKSGHRCMHRSKRAQTRMHSLLKQAYAPKSKSKTRCMHRSKRAQTRCMHRSKRAQTLNPTPQTLNPPSKAQPSQHPDHYRYLYSLLTFNRSGPLLSLVTNPPSRTFSPPFFRNEPFQRPSNTIRYDIRVIPNNLSALAFLSVTTFE